MPIEPAKVRLNHQKRDLFDNIVLTMQSKASSMKRILGIFALAVVILASSCSTPKPYYQTKKGKKKQKYYNEIQFGGKGAAEMKKP